MSEAPDKPPTGSDLSLEDRITEALRTVYDPEVPVNIYDLGLIYNVDLNTDRDVDIRMTLTSPACPVAGILPGQVQSTVQAVEGVGNVKVKLVWDPPWDQNLMSEAAQLELGLL